MPSLSLLMPSPLANGRFPLYLTTFSIMTVTFLFLASQRLGSKVTYQMHRFTSVTTHHSVVIAPTEKGEVHSCTSMTPSQSPTKAHMTIASVKLLFVPSPPHPLSSWISIVPPKHRSNPSLSSYDTYKITLTLWWTKTTTILTSWATLIFQT